MLPKKCLFALLVGCLLLVASPALAQSTSVTISLSRTTVEPGTSIGVTLTFDGLRQASNVLEYRGDVQGNDACEGDGLGNGKLLLTGVSNTLTRTATISSSCPVGQYTLEVTLRDLNNNNDLLDTSTVRFSVGVPLPEQQSDLLDGAFHRLGAIGLIYRNYEPELNIEIWGITPESEGYPLLTVTQAQIDAVQPHGLVASSPDRRAAVHVWHDRNVTISLGPNREGKIHLITLAGGLDGAVIGTTDTLTPMLSAEPTSVIQYVPFVEQQPARADGSLVHVVREGDTVNSIAFAYGIDPHGIIDHNQLADGGRWIYPGQGLVIRDDTSTVANDASLPVPVYAGDDE